MPPCAPSPRRQSETPPVVLVQDAIPADLAAIQAIYAHHVRTGLGSFELEPPTLAVMADRFRAATDSGYPYLVAAGGEVLGYAYVTALRTRPAYRATVENSLYVAPGALRRGVGRRLLGALIERCTAAGFRQMVAVIGDSGNTASIELHARAGFRHVGTLRAVGFKFGRWVDTVTMQRALGPGSDTPPE
ncbi:MAG: N-acetyltransferase family protein [Alphaproteobacteria bacterium]|nr:N-acetyltransferase family protein [Alphaproteobacteria bacterium]